MAPPLAVGFEDLPTVNASLNALSTILLSAGWWHIRKGNRDCPELKAGNDAKCCNDCSTVFVMEFHRQALTAAMYSRTRSSRISSGIEPPVSTTS